MATTPTLAIRYPDGSTKANQLAAALQAQALDTEAAILAAGIPPVQPMSIVVAATQAARDSAWGIPATEAERIALQNLGATTVRRDKGWTERYYATYNSVSNPAGASVAGWYQIDGGTLKGAVNAAGDTGWVKFGTAGAIPFATGWSAFNYTDAVATRTGLYYRLKNGLVHINGAAAKATWAANDPIATLTAALRPTLSDVHGLNCFVSPAGQLRANASGSNALLLNVSFPIN